MAFLNGPSNRGFTQLQILPCHAQLRKGTATRFALANAWLTANDLWPICARYMTKLIINAMQAKREPAARVDAKIYFCLERNKIFLFHLCLFTLRTKARYFFHQRRRQING